MNYFMFLTFLLIKIKASFTQNQQQYIYTYTKGYEVRFINQKSKEA